MAVGVQLQQLRADLRAEIGHSLNAAHGINNEASQNYLLRRTQEELFVDMDWPRQIVYRDIALVAGTRYYDYPADTTFDTINQMWCANGVDWLKMDYGITPDNLTGYNSDIGVRAWPLRRWRHDPDQGQIEMWPVPNVDGTARVEATLGLSPLIQNTDVCTLDSNLIVLFTAAEILADQRSEKAPVILQKSAELQAQTPDPDGD